MAVHRQTFRTVNLLGARGAIVDDRRRLIAGTTGHVVIDADAASLGSRNAHGVWSPSPAGLRALRRLARVTGRRWGILAARIRHDVLQAPFAPAVVVAHPTAALAAYLQERPGAVPRLQGGGRSVTELSAGRLRQRVPRPARPDQPGGAEVRRLREREARRDRRPERRRGRVRPPPQRGLRPGARSRSTPSAGSPAPSACRPRSSRRRCSSRSTRASRGRRRTRCSTGWSSRASTATRRPARPRWPSIPGRARSRRSSATRLSTRSARPRSRTTTRSSPRRRTRRPS